MKDKAIRFLIGLVAFIVVVIGKKILALAIKLFEKLVFVPVVYILGILENIALMLTVALAVAIFSVPESKLRKKRR